MKSVVEIALYGLGFAILILFLWLHEGVQDIIWDRSIDGRERWRRSRPYALLFGALILAIVGVYIVSMAIQ